MSEPTAAAAPRGRGRPRLGDNNETRERLLLASQQLFAERSFTQVSVREITDAAGVSLASVNYHFGSKDGLLLALYQRWAPSLIREREQLLREAMASPGTVEVRVAAVLRALVLPVLSWSRQAQVQDFHVPFTERLRLDGPPEVRALMRTGTAHLRHFVRALGELLPHLSRSELCWRLHFVLGIEHAIHRDAARLCALVGDGVDLDNVEAVTERVVRFCLPGWLQDGPVRKPGRR